MVATKLLTAAELEAMGAAAERLELIEGETIEVAAAGGAHGILGGRLIGFLSMFLAQARLGEVVNAETGFVVTRDPDSVLMPDVSFISAAKLPAEAFWQGFVPFSPDLAVEIESPSNTQSDLLRKIALYLEGGTGIVWLIRPNQQTVTVFRADAPERVFGIDDILDGGTVLPGFELPLAELFG
jgi:Uma2 family endonuclease